MPGGTAGQLTFLNQYHILPSHFGEMIGGAATDNTTADDNDLCTVFHFKKLPPIF
jgi:hypothetical protein